MRRRSWPILLVVLLALSACGGGKSSGNAADPTSTARASGYASGRDVATAAHCTHYTPEKSLSGTTTGTCTYNGHPQTVMWFPTTQAADGWRSLGPGRHGHRVLYEGQWMVLCSSDADCHAIEGRIGGASL